MLASSTSVPKIAMAKETVTKLADFREEDIASHIHYIRGERVMLDAELAR